MKISIITVCFNSVGTIRSTIESVLSQVNINLDYLIVDGNSTDGTVEIIKDYADKYPDKIKWISESDQGIYDAMNKGIRMATGDIIGILNSDDFYKDENILKTIETVFLENKIDVVFADVRFVRGDNMMKTVRYYSSGKFSLGKFRFGFMPAHPTFFTFKENFERYGYYKTDYKIAADFELLLRYLYGYKLKYKYLPLDIIKMRMGGVSTLSANRSLLNREIMQACRSNGLYTNLFILYMRYLVKIFEFIFV